MNLCGFSEDEDEGRDAAVCIRHSTTAPLRVSRSHTAPSTPSTTANVQQQKKKKKKKKRPSLPLPLLLLLLPILQVLHCCVCIRRSCGDERVYPSTHSEPFNLVRCTITPNRARLSSAPCVLQERTPLHRGDFDCSVVDFLNWKLELSNTLVVMGEVSDSAKEVCDRMEQSVVLNPLYISIHILWTCSEWLRQYVSHTLISLSTPPATTPLHSGWWWKRLSAGWKQDGEWW